MRQVGRVGEWVTDVADDHDAGDDADADESLHCRHRNDRRAADNLSLGRLSGSVCRTSLVATDPPARSDSIMKGFIVRLTGPQAK